MRLTEKKIDVSVFCGIAILVIAISAGGCATVYPERNSSDECLIIIKTEESNPDKLPKGRTYSFVLSTGENSIPITKGFLAIKTMQPGERIVAIKSSVGDNYRGTGSHDDCDVDLPYVRGGVVVSDFVFVHEFHKENESTVVSNISFRKINPGEAEKLLEEIQVIRGYSTWFDTP